MTQSGGQAAGIQLQVGLDLAYFRGQMQKVSNIASSEFTSKLDVRFNKRTLDAELNNLQRAIKRRVYRVEIGGNLSSLPGQIETLRKQLSSLEDTKIDVGVGAVKSLSKKDAQKIKTDLRQSILSKDKKILVPVSIKSSITKEDIRNFKNAVKSKLSGLSVDVKANVKGGGFAGSPQGAAGLMEFMQSQGMIGKTASGMEMRMKKSGDDLSRDLDDAVKSAEKIKATFDGIAKSIATTGKTTATVQGKRLGLGNVPLMSGSVERRIERAASSIAGTLSSDVLKLLYPEINKAISSFTALRGQVQQNASKLSGFSLIIGLAAFAGVPLAKSVVKLTGSANDFAKLLDGLGPKLESAFLKAASNILKASSTRLLTGGRLAGLLSPAAGAAGLLPPAYRGIGPSRNAGALPPAYRGIGPAAEPVGLLPRYTSRGARDEAMRQIGAGEEGAGKLALTDEMVRRRSPIQAARVREIFDPREFEFGTLRLFRVIGDALEQAAEQAQEAADQAKKARIDRSVDELMRSIDDAIKVAQARVRVGRGLLTGQTRVTDLGRSALPSVQPALPSARIAGLLSPEPPGRYRAGRTEETQAELFARREREARMRSALRSVDVMGETPTRAPARYSYANRPAMPRPPTSAIVPYGEGGALARTAPRPRRGGGAFPSDGMLASPNQRMDTAYEVASQSMENFRASQIPLIGGLKELGGEFAQATKQVLLYGTAYKGLAFITSLPGQVLNAAKSQQQYNNALQTATQDTGTFAKELLYVDNVQRAFGLNLETTRTGFVKLYASMAPTGFDSGSIEKLFTGISAATAALQLTPDKAERVIYAFGQMASKGQIMSEELKGQLGDVLPGALAIFSKAAGMSVKEFSKAMEDGEFVGNRFREVFAKVSDELMNRFGTGAQAAGKSLQGLLNTVGGDFQRTLQSFAPLADAAAQAILGPLGGALRQISVAAQIAMGEQDRVAKQLKAAQQDVSDLKVGGADAKEIKAAEQNVAALAARYETLNEAAKDPAIAQQVKNIKDFVAEIQKAATFTMNLAGIIGSVLNPLFVALGGNLTSVVGKLALLALGFNAAKVAALVFMGTVNTMKAVEGISRGGAAGATVLAAAYRALGVQATGAQIATIGATGATTAFGIAIKGLLLTTGIGAVVVLLGSLAAGFLSVGNSAKAAAEKAKQSIDAMVDAARTGNVAMVKMGIGQAKADIDLLEQAKGVISKKAESEVGIYGPGPKIVRTGKLSDADKAILDAAGISLPDKTATEAELLKQYNDLLYIKRRALKKGESQLGVAVKQEQRLGLNQPTPGTLPPEDAEELKRTKTRADNLSQYDSLQDQLAKNFTQHQIDLLDIEHQHKVSLMNVFYDLQESRANSHQKAAIRFQKELYNIAAEYQGAQLKAQAEVMKAQGSVAGGALPGGTAMGAYLQGNIGPTSTGPHFDVKKMGGGYFPRNYLDQYVQVNGRPLSSGTTVPGGTFAGHQRRGSHGWDYAFGEGRHAATLMGGAKWMEGSPTAHGEARKFQLPTGEQFQFLHGKSEGIGAPGKITADQSRSIKASQQTQLAIQKEKVAVTLKEVEAIRKMEVAMENYVASIVPIAEQDLQNRLLAQRIQLTTDIASPAILDAQIKYAEQEAMATENIRLNNEEIAKLSQAKDANGRISVETAARIETLRQANDKLKTSLPTSQIQLLTEAIDRQRLSLVERTKASQRDAEDNRQINRLIIEGMTRQEAEARVAADRLRGDYAKALEIARKEIERLSADMEILNLQKAQGKALTDSETAEYNRLAEAIRKAREERDKLEKKAPEVEKDATDTEKGALLKPGDTLQEGLTAATEKLADLTNGEKQAVAAANAIGDAFGTAFKGIITGSMTAQEALAGMFQSIADHFADMVAKMIAEWIKMMVLKGIEAIINPMAGLGNLGGGAGAGLSSAFGASGPTFNPDAFSMGALSGGGAFSAGGPTFNPSAFTGGYGFANGGIAPGGFTAFANGGMVTGPTMGLVGEGRYNEAIVPLPDGKSIPVELSGGGSAAPTVIVNVDAKGSQVEGNEQSANQLGRVISAAVQTELIKQQRPGGLLAR